MAYIVPADISQLALVGRHTPELETLARLKTELSSDYKVFHGVHWTREYQGNTAYGELDFVVVNRAGDVLLIEQKNGKLEETERGLQKQYDDRGRIIAEQIRRAVESVREKFKWQRGAGLNIDYLLYCPDHTVRNVNAAGINSRKIVDARSATRLADVIHQLLTPGRPADDGWQETVEGFFRQSFELVPDIHAYMRSGEQAFSRLSGGLAEVLGRLEMTPLRLRVRGVPGSGKTVVAERYYQKAIDQGKRPLLVCFNRPLKEKLNQTCAREGVVQTWNGLCAKLLESQGKKIDYSEMRSDPNFWDRIQDTVTAGNVPADWTFDTLIVDEGQDFKQEWFEILRLFGRGEPDILWLEDQDQTLLDQSPVVLDGFIGYRASGNYRSPESIARFVQKVVPFEFECANSVPGLGVSIHTYDNEEQQTRIAGRVLADLFRRGFRAEDIVILTLRGIDNSIMSGKERLGNYTLSRFTGRYDLLGNQVLSAGQIRFESIRRFKGQQAPAVIIVDVAPRSRPEAEFHRLLYTAMTRATVRLDVIAQAGSDITDRMLAASY